MQREATRTAPTLDTILQDGQFYNNVFVRRRLLSLSHQNCERSQRKESLTCGDSENSVLSQWSDDFPGTERAASSPSGLLRALPCSQPLASSPFHRYDKINLSIFEGGKQICSFTESEVTIALLCEILLTSGAIAAGAAISPAGAPCTPLRSLPGTALCARAPW